MLFSLELYSTCILSEFNLGIDDCSVSGSFNQALFEFHNFDLFLLAYIDVLRCNVCTISNYIQRSESLVVNDINDSTIPLVGLQSCKSPGEPHLRKSTELV